MKLNTRTLIAIVLTALMAAPVAMPVASAASASIPGEEGCTLAKEPNTRTSSWYSLGKPANRFSDDCFHQYMVNNPDTANINVAIVPSAGIYSTRDAALVQQSIEMWEDGVQKGATLYGDSWLANGFHLTTTVWDGPDSVAESPDIIVLLQNEEWPFGYAFAGIGTDGPVRSCRPFTAGFPTVEEIVNHEDFESHHEDNWGTLAARCDNGGRVCIVAGANLGNGVLNNEGTINYYDLHSHEFGHCLGLGHTGDASDFAAKMYPVDDIMSYEQDNYNPNYALCVSNLDIKTLAYLYRPFIDDAPSSVGYSPQGGYIPMSGGSNPTTDTSVIVPWPESSWRVIGADGQEYPHASSCPQPDMSLTALPQADGPSTPPPTGGEPELNITAPDDGASVDSGLVDVAGTARYVDADDADGDGVPDDVDQCPNEAGPASNDGCPLDNPHGTRIGTDSADDINLADPCNAPLPCDPAWIADSQAGLDLLASHIRDDGDSLTFTWEVSDGDAFMVDPSGDPADEELGHIQQFSLTTSFDLTPVTSYTVNLQRDTGSQELDVGIGKVVGIFSLTSSGAGTATRDGNIFTANVAKSQFNEWPVANTLQNLDSVSRFTQDAGSSGSIITVDTMDTIEQSSFTGTAATAASVSLPTAGLGANAAADPGDDGLVPGVYGEALGLTISDADGALHVELDIGGILNTAVAGSPVTWYANFTTEHNGIPQDYRLRYANNVDGLATGASPFAMDTRTYPDATGVSTTCVVDADLSASRLRTSSSDPPRNEGSTWTIEWIIPLDEFDHDARGTRGADGCAGFTRTGRGLENGDLLHDVVAGTLVSGVAFTVSGAGDTVDGDDYTVQGSGGNDSDGDGVDDDIDNCPTTPNADQTNTDGDAEGDACDADDDNDGVLDADDDCPLVAGTGADGCPVVSVEHVTISAPGATPVNVTISNESWGGQIDLGGLSGDVTITATWYEADGTVLDSDSVTVQVGEPETDDVTIDSHDDGASVDAGLETFSGIVDRAGSGGGASASLAIGAPAELQDILPEAPVFETAMFVAPEDEVTVTDTDRDGLMGLYDDLIGLFGVRTGPPVPSPSDGIGPGAPIVSNGNGFVGLCTANFVWEDQDGNHYLGAAGHCFFLGGEEDNVGTHGPGADTASLDHISVSVCVEACVIGGGSMLGDASLGNPVTNIVGDMVNLGDIVFARNNGVGDDFGIVEIPESLYDLVRPNMPVWNGPTGPWTPPTTDVEVLGNPSFVYGNAVGFGDTFPTKARAGTFTLESSVYSGAWVTDIASMQGDSGSAVNFGSRIDASEVVQADKAMGVLTHLVVGHPFVAGTTMERAVTMASYADLSIDFLREDETLSGGGGGGGGGNGGGTPTPETWYTHQTACREGQTMSLTDSEGDFESPCYQIGTLGTLGTFTSTDSTRGAVEGDAFSATIYTIYDETVSSASTVTVTLTADGVDVGSGSADVVYDPFMWSAREWARFDIDFELAGGYDIGADLVLEVNHDGSARAQMGHEGDHASTFTVVSTAKEPDAAPTAVAQASAVVVDEGDAVTLDGSGSSDDNAIASYAWAEAADSACGGTINGADGAVASWTAPVGSGGQTCTFELTVTDDAGQSSTDSVSVAVDEPPAYESVVLFVDGTDVGSDVVGPTGPGQMDGWSIDADLSAYAGQNVAVTTIWFENDGTAVSNVTIHLDVLIPDADGDGVNDDVDNCPTVANADQSDLDGDGHGDACDAFPEDATEWQDQDGDGVGSNADNCHAWSNPDQSDMDGDGRGDVCDPDADGDGHSNGKENATGSDPYDPDSVPA